MRNFLDIRYTFPGYTVLIFFIGFTFPNLFSFLEGVHGSSAAFVIGIPTLVGGAPIGFYTSQLWYFFLTWNLLGLGVYGNQNKKRKYIETLHTQGIVQSKDIFIQVLDYLFHSSTNSESLKDYVHRRWTMYCIMGSSIMAIISGIGFGILFRNNVSPYSNNPWLFHETVFIIVGGFLILLLISGMYIQRKEHENMVWVMIHNYIKNNPDWKLNFPKTFFEPEKSSGL